MKSLVWQPPLFEVESQKPITIPGFSYQKDFINPALERDLIEYADSKPWDSTWKRRVQQYGVSYGTSQSRESAPIPPLFQQICERLQRDRVFEQVPNQIIVNEYMPGQGIAAHTDYQRNYGERVASLSLGSPVVMDFTGPENEKLSHLLDPLSLFILTGPARYQWKHGIAARKVDKYQGAVLVRGRRLSFTFRNALIT